MITSCPKLHFKTPLKLDFNSIFEFQSPTGWNIDLIFSEIIQKSPRNHPDIIQSSSIFTTPQLGEKSSFPPDMARLLQVKTPLLNSIKTPLLEGKSRVLLDFNLSFCLLGIIPASNNLVSCHNRNPETQETMKNVEFSVCLSLFKYIQYLCTMFQIYSLQFCPQSLISFIFYITLTG